YVSQFIFYSFFPDLYPNIIKIILKIKKLIYFLNNSLSCYKQYEWFSTQVYVSQFIFYSFFPDLYPNI
ncbi:MAG: hypothetical protein O4M80_06080, partial [Buchnera aphidicola]|nr:hypothetical protein [Buchnera aphidicola]